jgi:uncharacterized RDD family membrane protein YckC
VHGGERVEVHAQDSNLACVTALPSTELVTGEAVLLDLRPASFATRGMALLLDLVVQGAIAFGLLFGLPPVLGSLDETASGAVVILCVVGVLVGVPVTLETLTRGRSAGKAAFGLRVVRDDGGPVRFRQALVRGLAGVGEIWLTFGSPAVICSMVHPRGKRIGDLLAGTYVVRERAGAAATPPVTMPPELAGWAAATDIGRLPDRLALSVRQFLARAGRLHPASRERLGLSLAGEVARHVAPPPPPGTHPEQMMAAVLAERRERDLRRLEAERRRRDARAEQLHRLPFGLE